MTLKVVQSNHSSLKVSKVFNSMRAYIYKNLGTRIIYSPMSPPILDMNKKTCVFGGTLRRYDATNDLQPLDFGGTYRQTGRQTDKQHTTS